MTAGASDKLGLCCRRQFLQAQATSLAQMPG